MQKGKVLIISQSYPNLVNPMSGIFVQRQAFALQEFGWEIKVISPLPWLPVNIHWLTRGRWPNYNLVPARAEHHGIEAVYPRYLWLPRVRHPLYWTGLWAGPVRKAAIQLHQSFPYDLIHSNMLYPEGWIGSRLARELGVGHVITSHGDDALPQPVPGYAQFVRNAVDGAGEVVAVSRSQRERIQKLIAEDRSIPVIYNGFDSDLFFPSPNQRQWAMEILNQQEPAVIGLFVGALQPAKGVFELEQSFRQLHAQFPNFRLVLVGDGPSRPQLEQKMADLIAARAVYFSGRVDGKTVARWMNAADFLILPSYTEGFPCVISEAMSCAKPIAATNVGGIGELVLDGCNGFLAQPGNVDSLTQNLKQLLRMEPEQRTNLGKKSQTLISDKSWRANAGQMDQIYLNVIRNFPG